MAAEQVDLVKTIVEAWERGDFTDVSWADPQIEFVVDDVLSRETWRGIAQLSQGWLTFLASWDEYRLEADEYRGLGDDRVLLLLHHGGRGRRSGVDIGDLRFEGAVLFELRDEKVIRLVAYLERGRALAELGIR
jgi:hypothetical protein